MTTRQDGPLWLLLALRIKLRLAICCYLARRALIRLVRRVIEWLESTA